MITDDELKQWVELCEGATAGPWGADYFEPSGIEESDFAFIVEARDAMPRLIAEVAHLKNQLGHDAQCAEQFRDENTALKAEVERLQEDNCAFRDWYAVLRDENTALKAEVERMRKLVLNAADFIQPCKLEQSIFSRREMAHMLRDLAVTK